MNPIFFAISLVAFFSLQAQAKLTVGATTQDVEAIVKAVGNDQVETFSVAKGTQDPHQIEAKPSFMVKFRGADLIVSQGLELETAWLVPLIQGSRNSSIAIGTKGFLELGVSLDPIEVAKGNVSRGEGDVHPNGNPHFQLDPIRLGKSAILIAERMGELDGSHKDIFRSNADAFQKRMEEKAKSWKSRIEKTGVKEFVSYHKSFSYFADRFGLRNTLHLEPKPGIPPTASHIIQVIEEMKARHVKVVLIENFFDDSVKGKLEKEIPGVRVIKVPVYVGGEDSIKTNEELIERIVTTLETTAK
jgi:zinc/manganese transport system substrate-binding protein